MTPANVTFALDGTPATLSTASNIYGQGVTGAHSAALPGTPTKCRSPLRTRPAARGKKLAVVFLNDNGASTTIPNPYGSTPATISAPESLTAANTQLVQAVTAANPNTVVVLNTTNPVLMPWVGSVKSVRRRPGRELQGPQHRTGERRRGATGVSGSAEPGAGRRAVRGPAAVAVRPRHAGARGVAVGERRGALRQFQYWSAADQQWLVAGGRRAVYVGDADSAGRLALQAAVDIPSHDNVTCDDAQLSATMVSGRLTVPRGSWCDLVDVSVAGNHTSGNSIEGNTIDRDLVRAHNGELASSHNTVKGRIRGPCGQ